MLFWLADRNPPRAAWFHSRTSKAKQHRRRVTAHPFFEPLEERQLLTVTSSVVAGALSVSSDASDAIAITSAGGNVKINGANPGTGAATSASITSITLDSSGGFANSIDLTGVTPAAFTGLTSVTDLVGDGLDSVTLGGTIQTTGDQTYANPVRLNADTVVASTAAGAVSFVSTVNSFDATARALTVNTTGNTIFGAAVGGAFELSTLTTDAGGETRLNGNVSTTGAQTYNDAVRLQADVVLASSAAGDITFMTTVNSFDATARALTVNSTGVTSFGAAVGGAFELSTLTTNALGETRLNGNVSTTGAQTYDDAVRLRADVVLASSASGIILFGTTVDSFDATARALTVNTIGVTIFGAAVGGAFELSTLTTDAGGETRLNGNVSTTGAQTYNDAVRLQADVVFASSTAGDISFATTVDSFDASTPALTVNATGNITFGAAVGGAFPLGAVLANASDNITLNGSLTSVGTVTFLANQDGAGSQGFTQNAGAVSTTNDTAAAISITVNTGAGGTGNATIRGLTTGLTAGAAGGRVTIDANAGAILDGDASGANNITSGNAVLLARAGVGTAADPIETTISRLEGAGATGGFFVANSSALTIGGISSVVGVSTTTGDLSVTSVSALTVTENVVSTTGAILLSAGETAAASGDDFRLLAGVQVTSTSGPITIQAGDNLHLENGVVNSLVSTAGTVTLAGDVASLDAAGTEIQVRGDITAATLTIQGELDGDLVAIRPTSHVTVTTTSILTAASGDTILLASPALSGATTINTAGGADSIQLQATTAGGTTTILAGDQSDAITIGGPANTLDPILGEVFVNGEAHDPTGDTLSLVDAGVATAQAYAFTTNGAHTDFWFQRSASAPKIHYATADTVKLQTGAGADRVDVQFPLPTSAAPAFRLQVDNAAGGTDFVRALGDNGPNDIHVGGIGSAAPLQISNVPLLAMYGFGGPDTLSNETNTPSMMSGGFGDDTLSGGSAADVLFGGPGIDFLFGNAGDDFIFAEHDIDTGVLVSTIDGGDVTNGGPGADTIVALGLDDAIIGGERISEDGAVSNIFTWLGAEITSVANVSKLINPGLGQPVVQASLAVPVPAVPLDSATLQPHVQFAYLTYLGRPADAGGLAFFTGLLGQGGSVETVRAQLLASGEYLANHGGTSAGFVAGLYADTLGRAPSPAEAAYWVGRLGRGASREDVALGFLRSPEGRNHQVSEIFAAHGLAIPAAGSIERQAMLADFRRGMSILSADSKVVTTALDTPPYVNASSTFGFINRLYAKVLGAAADAAGVLFWTTKLAEGSLNREQVSQAFLTSNAGRGKTISDFYLAFLGHGPDAAGLAYWVGVINAGGTFEQVQAALLSSPEFQAAHGPSDDLYIQGLNLIMRGVATPATPDQLAAVASRGRAYVASLYVTSDEFRGSVTVKKWYNQFFGRDPEALETAAWVSSLRGGVNFETAELQFLIDPAF